MPINLETPKKFQQLVDQAHMVATEIFRKNSRNYDLAEHTYPKELDMLAAVIEGQGQGGGMGGAGAGTIRSSAGGSRRVTACLPPSGLLRCRTWRRAGPVRSHKHKKGLKWGKLRARRAAAQPAGWYLLC